MVVSGMNNMIQWFLNQSLHFSRNRWKNTYVLLVILCPLLRIHQRHLDLRLIYIWWCKWRNYCRSDGEQQPSKPTTSLSRPFWKVSREGSCDRQPTNPTTFLEFTRKSWNIGLMGCRSPVMYFMDVDENSIGVLPSRCSLACVDQEYKPTLLAPRTLEWML